MSYLDKLENEEDQGESEGVVKFDVFPNGLLVVYDEMFTGEWGRKKTVITDRVDVSRGGKGSKSKSRQMVFQFN